MFFEKGRLCQRKKKNFWRSLNLKKGFGSGENTSGSIARNELFRGKRRILRSAWTVRFRKSTLLNIIGGIDSADSGYISINGDKLEDMSEKKLTQYRRKTSRLCISDVQSDRQSERERKTLRSERTFLTMRWISTTCYIHLDFTSTDTSCRTSCPAVSSSVFPSVVRS